MDVVLARSVPRFLGGVEFRHIFDLNHFTLPSESPLAALCAAARLGGSPTTTSPPCYQPEPPAAHSNAAPREREIYPVRSTPQCRSQPQSRSARPSPREPQLPPRRTR